MTASWNRQKSRVGRLVWRGAFQNQLRRRNLIYRRLAGLERHWGRAEQGPGNCCPSLVVGRAGDAVGRSMEAAKTDWNRWATPDRTSPEAPCLHARHGDSETVWCKAPDVQPHHLVLCFEVTARSKWQRSRSSHCRSFQSINQSIYIAP